MNEKLFVFHGHFYQPPRENPWTGLVSREASAAPFHDWNARIDAECYRPNAYGRIADEDDLITAVVNNYEHISFNVGATLLHWLQEHDPLTLQRMIDADRRSAERNGGHGNAIAQAYNHMILPLADARDRRTQIEWGLAVFRFHFGREAEAMWLPETAANHHVLDELIEANLRYAILAPQQAGRIRSLEGGRWKALRGGKIDPSRPYLYRHRDGSGRSLALFFYDGELANQIAFGDSLHQSERFIERVREADSRRGEGPLIHAAADGETAGHHNAWGDRVLAHVLTKVLSEEGIRVTNYGEVLDLLEPAQEVELDPGPDGEGTAWSCTHGVGRWIRDCGCSISHTPDWNQQWRVGLRKALDILRDSARPWFEEEASKIFGDPWAARDDYVQLLLEPSEELRREFLKEHSAGPLRPETQDRGLALLEMQQHLMLQYTSCGWFFDDITGLEGRQVLRYAARALDLWTELGGDPPARAFLDALGHAKSNLVAEGDGARFFRQITVRDTVDPRQILVHALLRADHADENEGKLGEWDYETISRERHEEGDILLHTALVQIQQEPTGRMFAGAVVIRQKGDLDIEARVQINMNQELFQAAARRLGSALAEGREITVLEHDFSELSFDAASLMSDGGRELLAPILDDSYRRFRGTLSQLFQEHKPLLARGLESEEGELMQEFRRIALEGSLRRELELTLRDGGDGAPLAARINAAQEEGMEVDLDAFRPGVEVVIEQRIEADEPREALRGVELASGLGIPLHLHRAQERWLQQATLFHDAKTARELGERLGIAPTLCDAALHGESWEPRLAGGESA